MAGRGALAAGAGPAARSDRDRQAAHASALWPHCSISAKFKFKLNMPTLADLGVAGPAPGASAVDNNLQSAPQPLSGRPPGIRVTARESGRARLCRLTTNCKSECHRAQIQALVTVRGKALESVGNVLSWKKRRISPSFSFF